MATARAWIIVKVSGDFRRSAFPVGPNAVCVLCYLLLFHFFSIAPALLAPNHSKCRYSKKAPSAFQVKFKSISFNKALDNI